jgi:hypothetical protein
MVKCIELHKTPVDNKLYQISPITYDRLNKKWIINGKQQTETKYTGTL